MRVCSNLGWRGGGPRYDSRLLTVASKNRAFSSFAFVQPLLPFFFPNHKPLLASL
ncbi:hypothetical protein APV28_2304 [Comamonas testosteroni]|nr:hypothetical protein APV28_2304 [Comamonas testosteroni]